MMKAKRKVEFVKRLVWVISLLLGAFWIGGCKADSSVRSRLSKLLEDQGYVMYTPFRTEDKPGTIFVLASNVTGKTTEMTLSTPDRTFNDRIDVESLLQRKDVAIADSLSQKHSFGAGLAADLLSIMVDAELASEYTDTITLEFGKPQVALVLPQESLTANRNELRDSTLETLRFYKDREQLNNIYFIFETVEVSSLKATGTLKSKWSGKVTAEELDPIAKADVNLNYEGGSSYTMTFDKPMLIGYKASRLPLTILGTAVSPEQDVYQEIKAPAINRIKGR